MCPSGCRGLAVSLNCLIALSGPARAESRSAVLIGIDVYNPVHPASDSSPVLVKRPPAIGSWLGWEYNDLHGAVKDVDLIGSILTAPQLGFKDVVVLRNEQATADAILSTLQHKLIDETKAGDLRLVYYSGHGSTVRNTASKERFQLDQTIVPSDHYKGNVPDIRDKEISRILWKAGKKGVKVIFIADSCHSGGLSRGAWNQRGLTRTARSAPAWDANPYPVRIHDPPDIDPETRKEINPVDAGVVMLAAAQEDEEAMEDNYTPDGIHGAFTWALKKALEQGLDQPLDVVVRRATSLLKTANFVQTPNLHGKDTHSIDLFGLKASSVASTTAIVERVDAEGTIFLRGGTAMGIYKGAELRRILSSDAPVEIRVTRSLDLARSEAEKVDPAASVRANDIFEVSKWVMPEEAALSVYLPPAAPPEVVFQVAAEIGKLRADESIRWVSDLTESNVSRIMHWDGKEWVLESNPASGAPVKLGTSPSAEDVRKLLERGANFFLWLPPATSLSQSLKLDRSEQNQPSSIAVLKEPGGQYRLAGRVGESGVEYAWIQPDANEESVRKLATSKDAAQRLPLPLRTDWIPLAGSADSAAAAGFALTDKAFRLGRLRSWLTLLAPPSSWTARAAFPYRLAFREVGKTGLLATNEMKGGRHYKMYLHAAAEDIRGDLPDRFIYVFSVDHFGKGTLLFPPLGEGNAGNRFPKRKDNQREAAPEIAITESDYDFEISEPYGVDTFIMLNSAQPIEDPQIFEFDGVRSKGSTRGVGYTDVLTQLLSEVGTSTSRAVTRNPAVPTTWGIEQIPVLSSK